MNVQVCEMPSVVAGGSVPGIPLRQALPVNIKVLPVLGQTSDVPDGCVMNMSNKQTVSITLKNLQA